VAGGVFISYRREDSAGFAGRIYDRLRRELDRDSLFFDVDNIEPGLDFVNILSERVGVCEALVAIVGRSWLSIRDDEQRRRIDDPHDFVRIEIEAALQRNIRVIPVLVDGARMPRAEELPDGLKPFSRRQAIEISHTRFDSDTERLTRWLRRFEQPPRGAAAAQEAEERKRQAERAEASRLAASEEERRREDEKRRADEAEAARLAAEAAQRAALEEERGRAELVARERQEAERVEAETRAAAQGRAAEEDGPRTEEILRTSREAQGAKARRLAAEAAQSVAAENARRAAERQALTKRKNEAAQRAADQALRRKLEAEFLGTVRAALTQAEQKARPETQAEDGAGIVAEERGPGGDDPDKLGRRRPAPGSPPTEAAQQPPAGARPFRIGPRDVAAGAVLIALLGVGAWRLWSAPPWPPATDPIVAPAPTSSPAAHVESSLEASCKAEFAAKKKTGQLAANAREDRYIETCLLRIVPLRHSPVAPTPAVPSQ
jgi:TIR domain-containing protein